MLMLLRGNVTKYRLAGIKFYFKFQLEESIACCAIKSSIFDYVSVKYVSGMAKPTM